MHYLYDFRSGAVLQVNQYDNTAGTEIAVKGACGTIFTTRDMLGVTEIDAIKRAKGYLDRQIDDANLRVIELNKKLSGLHQQVDIANRKLSQYEHANS